MIPFYHRYFGGAVTRRLAREVLASPLGKDIAYLESAGEYGKSLVLTQAFLKHHYASVPSGLAFDVRWKINAWYSPHHRRFYGAGGSCHV